MICKKSNGSGFRGLAQYLLRHGRGRIVAGPMAGRSPRELACEFGQLRRLNPKLRKAVMHFSISPAPDDPALSDSQWQMISQRFVRALGYEEAPWVAIIHCDTRHVHMHIMTSRIDLRGRTISNFNDFRKAEQLMRELETEMGLRAVLGLHTAVPDDGIVQAAPAQRRKSKLRSKTPSNAKTQGDNDMRNDTPANPFQPGDPQFETWPQPFEPGRDLAVHAFATLHPEVEQNSASIALTITEKEGRAIRRRIVDYDYEERMRQLLGVELTRVYKHGNSATLYFREKGEIRDMGSEIIATGAMDEKLAAQRVVALGCERGWKTITFKGCPSFLEHAMRTALAAHLMVITRDEAQSIILAKIMAERQGGMGSSVGPAVATTAPLDPALAILSELDDLPPQPWPKPAPTPKPVESPADCPPASSIPQPPKQPVVGVLPAYLNLRERLHSRRQLHAPTTPAPTQPAAPKKPGGP